MGPKGGGRQGNELRVLAKRNKVGMDEVDGAKRVLRFPTLRKHLSLDLSRIYY